MTNPHLNRRHDPDAYLDHLVQNLGHQMEKPQVWSFRFRSDDFEHLERVAESLADEFEVHLQESVETWEGDRHFDGPPLLAVMMQEALDREQLRALYQRFADLAAAEGLTYEGISSHDPLPDFEWLARDAAVWRMRHFTDTGLAEGDPLPWAFAMTGPAAAIAAAAAELESEPGCTLERNDDDDAAFLSIWFEGTNDSIAFEARYNAIEALAARCGAELLGAEFFAPDECCDDCGELGDED